MHSRFLSHSLCNHANVNWLSLVSCGEATVCTVQLHTSSLVPLAVRTFTTVCMKLHTSSLVPLAVRSFVCSLVPRLSLRRENLGTRLHTFTQVLPPLSFPPHQLQLSYRVPHSKHLTSLPATDPGGTITMVTASGRSFTRQIRTEDTAVQETNPATPGQLVLGN